MTESTKCDGGVAKVAEIGEHHLQDRNVMNDWGRDRGDEEED